MSDIGTWVKTDAKLKPSDPLTAPRVDRVTVTLIDGRRGKGKTVKAAIENAQTHKRPRRTKEKIVGGQAAS